jgi:signal transduction histidine kinase
MNHDVLEFSNAIAGETVWTHDVVAWATERFQSWFHRPDRDQLGRELNLRLEERHRECARIARELHDTLLQGFIGACMQLNNAMDQMPVDSPNRPSLSRALRLMQRVLEEGRLVLQGLRSSAIAPETLEQSLSSLRDEMTQDNLRFRIFVTGKSRPLKPAIREQLYLMGREALINALRHSRATVIEAEIEYRPRQLRMVVRDDGCGIDAQVLRSGRDGHWGLLGMRERAGSIGARLRMWSKPGCGTEVEICVPGDIASLSPGLYASE